MQNIENQKIKLVQKKNRLAAEEVRLKLKERKMRTRHLIEMGGLIVKAKLDDLSMNTLYGALISLNHDLKTHLEITKEKWTKLGKSALDQEQKEKIAIVLKFMEKPSLEIRSLVRECGLKWNKIREEWYGYATDINSLKENLRNINHNLKIIGETSND